jgi:hypothetical protein
MRYLFVITYGRSGSTMLQGVLNTIDGYCIRGENNGYLLPLLHSYELAKEGQEKFGGKRHDVTHPWHGADETDLRTFRRHVRVITKDCIIRPPKSARVIGFKEIRYLPPHMNAQQLPRNLRLMKECFQHVKFVFNRRNLDDTLTSGHWNKKAKPETRTEMSQFIAKAEAVTRKRRDCFMFDYDRREEYIPRLFDFLGEPYDEEVVRDALAAQYSTRTQRTIATAT